MTYDDKMLLELAAKAAGFNLKWKDEEPYLLTYAVVRDGTEEFWTPWNPLESGEDAFNLSILLSIGLSQTPKTILGLHIDEGAISLQKGENPLSAARRVITMLAASIGECL